MLTTDGKEFAEKLGRSYKAMSYHQQYPDQWSPLGKFSHSNILFFVDVKPYVMLVSMCSSC